MDRGLGQFRLLVCVILRCMKITMPFKIESIIGLKIFSSQILQMYELQPACCLIMAVVM
jgi:hypothetical protein